MPLMCEGLSCEYSFEIFNKIFLNGVPPEIAAAVTPARLDSRNPDQLYDIDVSEFGTSMMSHFERDWMGIGGESWFGPEAGDVLYKAFVDAIQTAGSRQIKAIWVPSSNVRVQKLEDERLLLLLVGSPRPKGQPHRGEDCGRTTSA